ncbi:hypothetical protein GGX14DRAFT_617707 [Mycena pura]|uniref:Uncharacterized protein n=1 Tax=Mycena pura TaxID=153505 RepID=A0AAD6YHG3_9AGAR|nr:hypothetical protein GGX14DRAFT_617707 [Mycena pura]
MPALSGSAASDPSPTRLPTWSLSSSSPFCASTTCEASSPAFIADIEVSSLAESGQSNSAVVTPLRSSPTGKAKKNAAARTLVYARAKLVPFQPPTSSARAWSYVFVFMNISQTRLQLRIDIEPAPARVGTFSPGHILALELHSTHFAVGFSDTVVIETRGHPSHHRTLVRVLSDASSNVPRVASRLQVQRMRRDNENCDLVDSRASSALLSAASRSTMAPGPAHPTTGRPMRARQSLRLFVKFDLTRVPSYGLGVFPLRASVQQFGFHGGIDLTVFIPN